MAESFLINNFISPVWRSDAPTVSRLSRPMLYPIGMINFTFSLPVRIAIVATTAIRILVLFAKAVIKGRFGDIGRKLKESGLVFLGSLGELISCVTGIVCPPLAYKIDEFIQSNRIINNWYHDHHLSIWNDRWDRDILLNLLRDRNMDRNIETILDNIQNAANEERMDAKEQRAVNHLNYFKNGKIELEKWVSGDQIDGMMPVILSKIAILGILGAIENEASLNVFVDEIDDYNLKVELEDKLKEIESSITECMKNHSLPKSKVVQSVARFVILEVEGENPSEYFIHGVETENELKNLLAPLEESQLQKIVFSLHQFTDGLFRADRTMCAVVGRAAYQ